jgi:hypothetical protein
MRTPKSKKIKITQKSTFELKYTKIETNLNLKLKVLIKVVSIGPITIGQENLT